MIFQTDVKLGEIAVPLDLAQLFVAGRRHFAQNGIAGLDIAGHRGGLRPAERTRYRTLPRYAAHSGTGPAARVDWEQMRAVFR
jgi:hypothetical protein